MPLEIDHGKGLKIQCHLHGERSDIDSVKLAKVHELFQVCRMHLCKEWCFIIWLNTAYYKTEISVVNSQNKYQSPT